MYILGYFHGCINKLQTLIFFLAWQWIEIKIINQSDQYRFYSIKILSLTWYRFEAVKASWSRMLLLHAVVTKLGILDPSGMSSRNLGSSNLIFLVLTLFKSLRNWYNWGVVKARPKYVHCIFLNGVRWVSVCRELHNTLCHMSRVLLKIW